MSGRSGARPRGQERDELLRQDLEPLAPGERPAAVTVSAVITALMCVGNLAAYAAGAEIGGGRPEATGIVGFCGLTAIATWGLWRARYWAVLAFQAVLTAIVIVFFMFLMRASNIEGLVVCLVIITSAGVLFWKLVKAMARIQMPNQS